MGMGAPVLPQMVGNLGPAIGGFTAVPNEVATLGINARIRTPEHNGRVSNFDGDYQASRHILLRIEPSHLLLLLLLL